MPLRPPRSFDSLRLLATGGDNLEAEILAEKANALGRSGRAVEQALAALRAADPGDRRTTLAFAAAEAVQAFFIQRELMGLRRHDEAVAKYDIPREVLAKIGVRP